MKGFEHVATLHHNETIRTVYLDNAASTQMPQPVIDRIIESSSYRANTHRGEHHIGNVNTDWVEATRRSVAKLIGANGPDNIVFTSGTTHSINLVAHGVTVDGVVAYTELEHHANILPWQMYAGKKVVIPVTETGDIDFDIISEIISSIPTGSLLAITHISNVTGAENDVHLITKLAHQYGHKVLVDAAQSVLTTRFYVGDIDYVAFSAHKMYGPTGVGVLYAKDIGSIRPIFGGGGIVERAYSDYHTLLDGPAHLEAGTPNIIGIAGFGAAVDYVDVHREEIINNTRNVLEYAFSKLSGLVNIIGPNTLDRGPIISFTTEIHPADLSVVLDVNGVAVRGGMHCAHPLHRRLGINGSIRASFASYNTRDDIDILCHAIEEARRIFC